MNGKSLLLALGFGLAGLPGNAAGQDGGTSELAAATVAAYSARVDPSAFRQPEPERKRDRIGTVADPAAIRLITPGVDKFSIYRLIGPPHFGEGITRRWNYVLRIPAKPASAERLRCRMEIRFAKVHGHYNVAVSEVIWEDQACADRVASAG
ncbi:hypothetical protein ACIPPQ_21430 [Sphingopyxis sp. LARHCG72]